MLLKRVSHSRALPKAITSHQMVSVSKIIHGHVSEAIEPLLETKPKYHAMNEILGTVGQAITQLTDLQRKRKVKSPEDLRETGGRDGVVGPGQVSQRKRTAYETRQVHMRRLRQAIMWQMMDIDQPDTELTPLQIEATKRLHQILDRRIHLFESMNYEESHTEFDNFIADIEDDLSDAGGLAALAQITLSGLYARMKKQHQLYIAIHKEQTHLDALREESPKFPAAKRELRRAIRVLLTNIHFDIENGDDTLARVLGDIDEVIDKVRAVGKRRKTLDEQTATEPTAPSEDDTETDDDSASKGEMPKAEAKSPETEEVVPHD